MAEATRIEHPNQMDLEELQMSFMVQAIALAKVIVQAGIVTVQVRADEPPPPWNVAFNLNAEEGVATLCLIPAE